MVKCLSRGLVNQYIAGASACLSVVNSAACYGWVTPILDNILGPDSVIPMTEEEASLAISISELPGLIVPLPIGFLSNYIGRKPVLLASGPLFIISWLMIVLWPSMAMLMVARIIQGIAVSLAFTAAPVYLGEIASDSFRGNITSIFFNCWWLGYLVEYAVGPYLSFIPFTYFTLALNVPFLVLFFWQLDSPYYYMMKGNEEKALESLQWFRDSTPEGLKEELEKIKLSSEDLKKSLSMWDIVATPEDRKALMLLMSLTAVRLLSGAGSLLVYATNIFDHTPNCLISSDNATIMFGTVMLIGGCISSFTSDSLGRRPLLMISCIGSFICQLFTGIYYYLLFNTSWDVSGYSWIAVALIILYSGLCSFGMFPVCAAYTSELFTSNTRGIASSLSTINANGVSFIALVAYQPTTDFLGLYANFIIYAVIVFVGGIYFYFAAPETKGKSFHEIRTELCANTS
ncbi:facilitated trehalose transporter Tret1-like [Homalodisca vitripennis]|uniref:facilitated trehalose transporter Tret1-like n=1 Tax=Homalodisca vitripennis TaxID=197043 RepID=UPI001EECC864|nr:facilitated trehalose transporter Tret1-like [Homalodisca vitripennis]XP_046669413.1 facilitated trehalose transporter Tret1-like [Homalodisca vitripennis]